MNRICQILLLFLALVRANAQVTVTLACSRDLALGFHDGAGTANINYGSAQQNAAFWIPSVMSSSGTNGNRALIDFNLTSLPPNATVISASLNLYATGPYGTLPGHVGNNNSSYLRRVTQSWQEFTTTWNTQPAATAVNQETLPQSTSSTQNYPNINVTALVQDMLANPGSSFGFQLRLVNEVNTNGLLFASKDHYNQALRPTLIVTYSACPTSMMLEPIYQVICSGSTATFSLQNSGTNYSWYNSATGGSPLGAGPVFVTPALIATGSALTYSYYVGVEGCSQLPRILMPVTVMPQPVVVISSPSLQVCAGQSLQLLASGAVSYSWNTGNLTNFLSVSPANTTTFFVTGTSSSGCSGSAAVTITVLPLPDLTVSSSTSLVCRGTSAVLTASGAALYSWAGSDQTFFNGNPFIVSPASTVTYTLSGTTGNCSSSKVFVINVSECSGLEELGAESCFFYPNPCKDILNLVEPDQQPIERIDFFDTQGKSVRFINNPDPQINISALPRGLYLCRIRDVSGKVSVQKLIVE